MAQARRKAKKAKKGPLHCAKNKSQQKSAAEPSPRLEVKNSAKELGQILCASRLGSLTNIGASSAPTQATTTTDSSQPRPVMPEEDEEEKHNKEQQREKKRLNSRSSSILSCGDDEQRSVCTLRCASAEELQHMQEFVAMYRALSAFRSASSIPNNNEGKKDLASYLGERWPHDGGFSIAKNVVAPMDRVAVAIHQLKLLEKYHTGGGNSTVGCGPPSLRFRYMAGAVQVEPHTAQLAAFCAVNPLACAPLLPLLRAVVDAKFVVTWLVQISLAVLRCRILSQINNGDNTPFLSSSFRYSSFLAGNHSYPTTSTKKTNKSLFSGQPVIMEFSIFSHFWKVISSFSSAFSQLTEEETAAYGALLMSKMAPTQSTQNMVFSEETVDDEFHRIDALRNQLTLSFLGEFEIQFLLVIFSQLRWTPKVLERIKWSVEGIMLHFGEGQPPLGAATSFLIGSIASSRPTGSACGEGTQSDDGQLACHQQYVPVRQSSCSPEPWLPAIS